MHIVIKILVIPNYLPLLILCVLKILASLHIICIPSLLVFKMLSFTHKIWGKHPRDIGGGGEGVIIAQIVNVVVFLDCMNIFSSYLSRGNKGRLFPKSIASKNLSAP